MDFCLHRSTTLTVLTFLASGLAAPDIEAETPQIRFDMPAITTAIETSAADSQREVTFDLVLSSLIVGSSDDTHSPPVEHMLVQCRLRDRLPVVDFSPKTELQTDYAGPISISTKDEQTDSFGFNVDGTFSQFARGHIGADDSHKTSDSTQFQRQAPMQAVISSGTSDRGRGVYFKMRWTNQHVLEGEKHFRVSFAVPASWRGGLVDVHVTANGVDRSLFGSAKNKTLASRHFVVAVHQQNDPQAAEIALRLAHLDQKLATMAKHHSGSTSNPVTQLWRRVLPPDTRNGQASDWYEGITSNQTDPYTDKHIQSLPMAVRVAVLGYTDAARELMKLGDAG